MWIMASVATVLGAVSVALISEESVGKENTWAAFAVLALCVGLLGAFGATQASAAIF